jgi:transcriptional regulator with XRE-family HTH domain
VEDKRPQTNDESYDPLKPGMPLTFGKLLRHIRKSRGMTLAQVSEATGIDPATISKMELGDRLPPELHALVKIASALEIPEVSDGFNALATLALDERAGADEATEATQKISTALNLMRPTDAAAVVPVFVNDLAELIARSMEEAIRRDAKSVTVRFEDGSTKRFEVHYEGVEVL